jgi:hypothetical protein
MLRFILRLVLVRLLVMFATPYVTRFFDRLATRAPRDSFLQQTLLELSSHYSLTLVRSVGVTLGGLFLGSRE